MLRQGYLEIIGLTDPRAYSSVKDMVARYEGVHIVAIGCREDADTVFGAQSRKGLPLDAPRLLERDAAFGPHDEGVRRARFRNAILPRERYPEARFQYIEHLTREVLWQPHLLEHPNGAQALSQLWFASDEPGITTERLVPIFGSRAEADGDGGMRISLGRGGAVEWIVGRSATGAASCRGRRCRRCPRQWPSGSTSVCSLRPRISSNVRRSPRCLCRTTLSPSPRRRRRRRRDHLFADEGEDSMRAAVIYEHGNAQIRIDPGFADPVPGEGEVVVRVGASSLNYHDIFTRRGMAGHKVPMPVIMGLDLAGEIVALGEGAGAEWKKGDRVLVDPIDRVGAGGLIGEMRHGGLAELCKVPVHQLVRLPDNVSFEAAACLPVAYGTALGMMYTIGNVQKGERVLILGASGGVGTCCVQLAKMAGADVIACASSEKKLAQLGELGADHLIDYKQQDFAKAIYGLYGKPHRRKFEGGVDVAVNFTGGETSVPTLKVVHRRGRILTCGATAGFDPKEDYALYLELRAAGAGLERLDARRPGEAP